MADTKRIGILTLAFGDIRFINMARTLSRSLMLHCPSLPKAIVTDADDPCLRKLYDVIIPLNRDYGDGMNQKLHLMDYTPFDETIYIDVDSIVIRDIRWLQGLFRHVSFGVIGDNITHGDMSLWCGMDAEKVGLTFLPRFNGGVYFFRKGEVADKIICKARQFSLRYDALKLNKFRGGVNDEILISLALSSFGIRALEDKGKVMRTLLGIRGPLHVDVLRGHCSFNKRGTDVQPAILHFTATCANGFHYKRESLKLFLCCKIGFKKRKIIATVVNIAMNPLYAVISFVRSKIMPVLRPVSHGR